MHMLIASRRRIIFTTVIVGFVALTIFAVVPQLDQFSGSLETLGNTRPLLLTGAIGLSVLSYAAAAATYQLLSLRPLTYLKTLAVQLAGLLVNRVLPAGIGGIGLNYAYLTAHRHNKIQAGIVVAANTVMGGIGHALLLGIVVISSIALHQATVPYRVPGWVTVALPALAVSALLCAGFVYRRKLRSQILQLRRRYTKQRLILALLSAMTMTAAMAGALWLSLEAVGIATSFGVAFLLLTAAVAVGTATPTPGGLGGFEAALVGGLVALRVDAATALAGTLLYRLITYWLGLCIGAIALAVVLKNQIITPSQRKS